MKKTILCKNSDMRKSLFDGSTITLQKMAVIKKSQIWEKICVMDRVMAMSCKLSATTGTRDIGNKLESKNQLQSSKCAIKTELRPLSSPKIF